MADQETLKRVFDEIEQLKQANVDLERRLKAKPSSTDAAKGLKIFSEPCDTDVLALNIGGTKLDVARGTLTCVPSLLASKFSGEWDSSLPRDSDGRFFIDEEPELFIAMVNFLRDSNRMTPSDCLEIPDSPSFADDAKQKRFSRMVDAFHLSDHFFPVQLWKYDVDEDKTTLVNRYYNHQVNHVRGDSYYFIRQANDDTKAIQSFEARLSAEPDSCISIGWMDHELLSEYLGCGQRLKMHLFGESIDVLGGKGPDGNREREEIEFSLFNEDNPVIRCVDKGAKWFIDGKLVAEVDLDDMYIDSSEMQPFIQITGVVTFQVLSVEFEP